MGGRSGRLIWFSEITLVKGGIDRRPGVKCKLDLLLLWKMESRSELNGGSCKYSECRAINSELNRVVEA